MGILRRKKKQDREQDVVVDVRDQGVIDLSEKPAAVWGFPTRCPECGDYGYLDRIDVRAEVMFQHCPTCFARWETPRSATVAEA